MGNLIQRGLATNHLEEATDKIPDAAGCLGSANSHPRTKQEHKRRLERSRLLCTTSCTRVFSISSLGHQGALERRDPISEDSAVQILAKINNPFSLRKLPAAVRGLGGVVVDRGIRSQLAKASCHQERFDLLDQASADFSPPQFLLDPDAFEKRNRLAVTAIGVRPDRDFRESGGCAIARFCNKADEYKPSRRRIAPIPPTSAAPSVSAKTRSFVCTVKVRRRGRSNSSGAAVAGAGTAVGLRPPSASIPAAPFVFASLLGMTM